MNVMEALKQTATKIKQYVDTKVASLGNDITALQTGKAPAVHSHSQGDVTGLNTAMGEKIDRSQLFDAGIKSISWSVARSEVTVQTTEDIYKSNRPSYLKTKYWGEFEGCPYFKHSRLYRVTFNGTVYDNLACDYGIIIDYGNSSDVGGCWQLIGNKNLYNSLYQSTGEPFCIMYVEHGGMQTNGEHYFSNTVGNGILLTSSASSNTVKIEVATYSKAMLPKPLNNNFGLGDRTYQNFDDSTYPRVSLGQGNICWRGSFAIGISNLSSGLGSMAEGTNNVIDGAKSHAEGTRNKIPGSCSHCEGGLNTVSGQFSHCEGYSNSVSGNYSHAEGAYGTASGIYSHIEGGGCVASGRCSHSEGFYVKALSENQHAQGKYNIEDSGSVYAHIVGNGESEESRSNAHTLDWSGNAWYKGKIESESGVLKLGGTEITESELQSLLESGGSGGATVTQTITSGTEIGKINGTALYVPESPDRVSFRATYNSTTFDEIKEHYDNGEIVFCVLGGVICQLRAMQSGVKQASFFGFAPESSANEFVGMQALEILCSGGVWGYHSATTVKSTKYAMTDTTETWSATEQATARAKLGITVDDDGICRVS